jgi:hypothetical protein
MLQEKYNPKTRAILQPISPSIAYVVLTKGLFSRISSDSVPMVSNWSWYARFEKFTKTYYAMRETKAGGKKTHYLHRQVMDVPLGMVIDHIDGDTLNNCLHNLRICTPAENTRNQKVKRSDNTSGFRGVTCKASNHGTRCIAQIMFEGKRMQVGTFPTKEDAAHAYDEAAIRLFGDFARTNFRG